MARRLVGVGVRSNERPGATRPHLRLDPAALGGDQDGLGPVAGAQLAVDVVQVGADRARGEVELTGDLLVDHSAGQAAYHLKLTAGHWAGIHGPGAGART